MMRLSALKPTSEKVVKLHMHPTHPWLTYADTNDNVVVWDWDHRQVLYEIKAGGVDERRLAGAQLQKIAEGEPDVKAKAAEGIKGGSVKHIRFYDDDVRFWQTWINRAAAGESPVAVNQKGPPIGAGPMTIRGRHFLVICCENKVIFQDLVSMKSRDVSKSLLENRSPLCVEFLPRSIHGDGPLAAFGGSDGIIRVLSMSSWQLVRRYAGGHKGSVFCLTTLLSSTGESLLISGGSDGLLVFWPADNLQATREVTHKLALKAHDGGVTGMDIVRVQGSSPLLVTIGADKTLAVWQTSSLKEFKRVKPVQKLACHSVASWCHPRVPGINILTCVKDSHIWAIESVEAFGTSTRALCDLSAQLPASMQLPNKKLKVYCMAAHPLQPNLVATGTNFGVFLSEFDLKAVPAAVALPTPAGSREHNVICASNRELKLLSFQLSQYPSGAPGHAADLGRARAETVEALQFQVKQIRRPVVSLPHDSYSWISTSKSGKYVSVVWPDVPAYAVYNAKDWNIVDSGQARYFAWDSCKERYALIQLIPGPKLPPALKGGSKKAREAAAQAAAVAAAAAASAAVSASVEVRILLDDGSSNLLAKAIEGRNEPVAGLQGGALLGVAYKMSQKSDMHSAAAALAAHRNGSSSADEGFAAGMCLFSESPPNFQLYSWETFQPVGGLLPQPVWSTWDEAVEFCALAFEHYVAICSLRPTFRYLGNVGIESATGGVWHRRQLFVATPTTIECVFVDAGVNAADLEWKAKTKELKALEEQSNAVAQHGELALITVEVPKASTSCEENLPLRPPMLQVVRLASFQSPPSVPPFLGILKQPPIAEPDTGGTMKELEEKKVAEVAVAGGGVSVAISRLPPEQKRPVGPLVVIGVRDGVLWLVDRYMAAHAIGLTHPGIRCRCLAAYGDPVSAVKWASRLGREHHDDFAQFMLGMGYAQEALHLPGISKRLEYELAMESGDLKRALHCLVTLSNSKDSRLQLELESGFQELGRKFDAKVEMVNTVSKAPQPIIQDNEMYTLFGIANFAGEYLRLIDAADATGKREINSQALRRLAAADTVPDAFEKSALRGLALRLAMHGEMSRLAALASTLIAAGQGHEGALAAALLGDSSLLEKALQEAGLFAEAALHAHAHGRGSLKTLLEHWYRSLDKEENQRLGTKAEAPVSAIPSSGTPFRHVPISFGPVQPDRHPLVEIIPPGNVLPAPAVTGPSLHQSTATNRKTSGQHAERALMIEMPSMVLGAVPPPLSLPRSVGEGAILPIASGVSGGLVPSAGPVSAPDPFAAHKPDGIFAAFPESPFTATEPLGSTFKPS